MSDVFTLTNETFTPWLKVVDRDLKAQNGGTFQYEVGTWTPEVNIPSICIRGYHVTKHPSHWIKPGSRVFQVDVRGMQRDGTDTKSVCQSIRLVRERDDLLPPFWKAMGAAIIEMEELEIGDPDREMLLDACLIAGVDVEVWEDPSTQLVDFARKYGMDSWRMNLGDEIGDVGYSLRHLIERAAKESIWQSLADTRIRNNPARERVQELGYVGSHYDYKIRSTINAATDQYVRLRSLESLGEDVVAEIERQEPQAFPAMRSLALAGVGIVRAGYLPLAMVRQDDGRLKAIALSDRFAATSRIRYDEARRVAFT